MAELYRRYAPALRAYCGRRLIDQADVDDIVHDTFLRAQRAVATLDAQAPLWPWLATIAARLCLDAGRRHERRRRLDPPAPTPVELDEEVAGRLRRSIVGDALRRLSPAYRSAVVLHHLAGWSHKDMAQSQGRSVAAIRSELLRARRQLRHRVRDVAEQGRQWPLPTAAPLARRARHLVDHVRAATQAWLIVVDVNGLLQSAGVALFVAAVVGLTLNPWAEYRPAPAGGPLDTRFAAAGPVPARSTTAPDGAGQLWTPSPPSPLGPTTTVWRGDVAWDDAPVDRRRTDVLKEPRGTIEDRGSDIWTDFWIGFNTPVYEGYGIGTTGNTNCTQPNPVLSAARQAFCTAVRAVIPHLPPDGPIQERPRS